MTSAQPTPLSQPPLFGQDRYVLPDGVHTNLPRHGYDGEPGSWERARGLLLELGRQLSATPVALYHQPQYARGGNPAGLVVTAIVRRGDGQITTVIVRLHEGPVDGTYQRSWQVIVDGVTHPGGRVLASPPLLAQFVAQALRP